MPRRASQVTSGCISVAGEPDHGAGGGPAKREPSGVYPPEPVGQNPVYCLRMKTQSLTHPWFKALAISALVSGVAFTSGCVAVVAAGAAGGGVAYVRGELDATLDSGYLHTVDATRHALDDLHFAREPEKADDLTTVFIARTGDDKKIEITVRRTADKLSKVEIRVGTFGDQELSQTILDRIKRFL